MNYRQLEELCKKMTIELSEQEKEFIDVATKVNYYDKCTLTNGDKIVQLNFAMDKQKCEHDRMEGILDLLKTYQKDFESCLDVLESVSDVSTGETTRTQLYQTLQFCNIELREISERVKEVIGLVNVANKATDRTDPVSQINRILNEHTDSLQWLEDQTIQLKELINEVRKFHVNFRRDQERALRLMFKPA